MNVSVDNLGACKKLLRVEVSEGKVNSTFDEIASQFQKQVQLPGFRPGKAPAHLIAASFEGKIKEETRKKLFQDSYKAAAEKEKLRVIVTLNVEEQQFGRSMPYSYTVTCETAPEFEIPEYKGLRAKREISSATETDVTRALNILRDQHVKYNDVDRELRDGDVAVVNYRGTSEGKPLTDFAPTARGLTEKDNFWIAMAREGFIPGFTQQIEGSKKGEKRTVKVTFPEDFVTKELAKREGVYEVEIVLVKEKILPEVTDEFAKGFGANSVQELTDGIRRDLQNELDFRNKRLVRDQLLQELMSKVEFELPESVVASETKSLVYSIVNDNQQRGVTPELIEENKEQIFKNAGVTAKERVKAGFVLGRIAEKERIHADKTEITQRVMALAQQNNTSPDKMLKTLQERNAIPEIAQEIATAKVMDLIEVNAHVEEVPVARP